MWGKIKHEYPKEAKLTWLKAKAAKTCYCSKQDVKNILKKREKLGAIKMLQIGSRGAALYVREHDEILAQGVLEKEWLNTRRSTKRPA